MSARRLAGNLAATGTFAATALVLLRLGSGPLAAPPLTAPAQLTGWFDQVGAPAAAMAAVRLVALGASCWFTAASVAVIAARLRPTPRVRAVARRIAPLVLQHALGGLAGVTVLAGATGSSADVDQAISISTPADRDEPAAGTVVLRLVPPRERSPDVVPEPQPDELWVVAPGDSCWRVADEVLTERLGRAPTDAEIVPYWRQVIDANRDRFVTGDPDLLVPGQDLVVP
jgi:hypothetical protein